MVGRVGIERIRRDKGRSRHRQLACLMPLEARGAVGSGAILPFQLAIGSRQASTRAAWPFVRRIDLQLIRRRKGSSALRS